MSHFRQTQMLEPGDLIIVGPTHLCVVAKKDPNLSKHNGTIYAFEVFDAAGATTTIHRAWYEEVWISETNLGEPTNNQACRLALQGLDMMLSQGGKT